jgi:hypothetical protein
MPASEAYLARDELLHWLNSGKFREDYRNLPAPLNEIMGGATYREKMIPVHLRIVSRSTILGDTE